MPTQTVTVEQELTIKPKMRQELRTQLTAWQELKNELDRIKEALAERTNEITAIREDLGVNSLEFECYKITYVTGTTSTFDKQEFVRRGGDLALYNACHHSRPKKPYTLITVSEQE